MRLLKLLLESAVSEINNEDTHFAIEKSSGKIVRSWDFKDIGDPDTKLMIEDIIDQFPDRNPSEFSILTRRTLKNRNINVNDTNNWLKESFSEKDKTPIQALKIDLDDLYGNTITPIVLSLDTAIEAIKDKKYEGPVMDFPGMEKETLLAAVERARKLADMFMKDYLDIMKKYDIKLK